jgi:hypothetical protein
MCLQNADAYQSVCIDGGPNRFWEIFEHFWLKCHSMPDGLPEQNQAHIMSPDCDLNMLVWCSGVGVIF